MKGDNIMNKRGYIERLKKELNMDEEKVITIESIMEDSFIIGKKNKETKINKLIEVLNINEEEANHIYEVASSIIAEEIKNKIKHPFGSNK